MARAAKTTTKDIESLNHREARRKHIPTAELESLVSEEERAPKVIRYKRNTDLDPQLVWRGKDEQDAEDLMVDAVPIYIQEKIKPEQIISDLKRRSEAIRRERAENEQYAIPDLYSDFNGLAELGAEFDFYKHHKNWSNRMILGDSLLVMTSLAEKEALKSQVQCIYMDPPYGIKFNSNWQPSTKSREVKDGQTGSLSREPEMIRAFRDTWKDGIRSYLSYLRDRLTAARTLLADTGSIFVQIGEENFHLIKALVIEVFGSENYITTIAIKKKGSTVVTESVFVFLVWCARSRDDLKIRRILHFRRDAEEDDKFNTLISPDWQMVRATELSNEKLEELLTAGWEWVRVNYPIVSQHPHETRSRDYIFRGNPKKCGTTRQWSFDVPAGLDRLSRAGRLYDAGGSSLAGVVFHKDRKAISLGNLWDDVKGEENLIYVVQTAWRVVQRALYSDDH